MPPSAPPATSQRQTDVRKRTILPTTLQNLRSTASSSSQAELDLLNSDEYLDKLEEELNRKVDGEVDGLVEGLKELIALARVSLTFPYLLEGSAWVKDWPGGALLCWSLIAL